MECCGVATKDASKNTLTNGKTYANFATDQIVVCNRKDNPVFRYSLKQESDGSVQDYDYTFQCIVWNPLKKETGKLTGAVHVAVASLSSALTAAYLLA